MDKLAVAVARVLLLCAVLLRLPTIAAAPFLLFSPLLTETALAQAVEGWRLPFNGTVRISAGPYVHLHTNASSEAIDYIRSDSTSFPVVAPAGGTVLDVLNVDDFGTVLRINHADGITSFFAHLTTSSISLRAGDFVSQGQQVAMTGNTGQGAGNHLHFEARIGAIAGNVYSGSSIPIRAIPGNWWDPSYSPPPNFQRVSFYTGAAQHPERTSPPTILPNGRHLANDESPPNPPAVHISDVTDSQVTIHMGGSPSTPGDNRYNTRFYVQQYRLSCLCWEAIADTYSPVWTQPETFLNQSNTLGAHRHAVSAGNQLRGWSTTFRMLELWTGNSAQRIPYIAATYEPGDTLTILEYGAPGADMYAVWERHDDYGSIPTHTYTGKSTTIHVDRHLNAPNYYIVQAHYPDGTWSPWTIWLELWF